MPEGFHVVITKDSARASKDVMATVLTERPGAIPPWLFGGLILTVGGTLTLVRVHWERANIITTMGVYEGGKNAGLINCYLYTDECGVIHRQGFPVLIGFGLGRFIRLDYGQFEVQYYRDDPANGWIKSSRPSAPLLLLGALDALGVLLLLAGAWLVIRDPGPVARHRKADPVRW